MVSGWAKSAPFLWAVLPPLALCVVEVIALRSSRFASLLAYRFGGVSQAFVARTHGGLPQDALPMPDPLRFLATPGLWAGLAVAAAFIAAAVWQRRYR